MAKRSTGGCKFCGKEYTRSGMIKHLQACPERLDKIKSAEAGSRQAGPKQTGYFSLSIEGRYSRLYWLLIEMPEDAKLKDLDQFLRDIWLECCGHMSAFTIEGVRYEAPYDRESFLTDIPSRSMNHALKTILEVGMVFEYEYDFGSTTDLIIHVFGHRQDAAKRSKVTIMARNKPPEILCEQCGKYPATGVCTECVYDGDAYLCDECRENHECGEDMILNLTNSPRCGVCAYEGSAEYPDY